jgi:hypothetical protein
VGSHDEQGKGADSSHGQGIVGSHKVQTHPYIWTSSMGGNRGWWGDIGRHVGGCNARSEQGKQDMQGSDEQGVRSFF